MKEKPLAKLVEAMVFASESPVGLADLEESLRNYLERDLEEGELLAALEELAVYYAGQDRALELCFINGGYQFLTKAEYQGVVGTLLKHKNRRRLSKAALETLAIIAYQQPLTKSEIEQIRGVSCDYAVHKLLEKELVEIRGRSQEPGRPLLYGTSSKFMQHFGLGSMRDLPKLKELALEEELALVQEEES